MTVQFYNILKMRTIMIQFSYYKNQKYINMNILQNYHCMVFC